MKYLVTQLLLGDFIIIGIKAGHRSPFNTRDCRPFNEGGHCIVGHIEISFCFKGKNSLFLPKGEFSDVTIMIIGDSLPESESHSLDLDALAKDGGGEL